MLHLTCAWPAVSSFCAVITENVHIEYRRGHSTCGVSPAKAHCASAMLLPFALPRERYLSVRYWWCRSLSLWVKCSQLWQCRRGVTVRIDSLKDFHLQWKIMYKSCFIENNYKKVVYLGKEVYDTPTCSLVLEFKRALEGETCNQ